MVEGGDPRVFFAGERTLLAWIRTGLAFMGFGFVLARYRIFLPGPGDHGHASLALGVALVCLGVFSIVAPLVQFRRFVRTLPTADLPGNYSSYPALVSAIGLAVFGVLLAVYLLIVGPSAGGIEATSPAAPWSHRS